VLDMTQYEAGTSCTQLLAWLGAEVVKVESPSGDPGRFVARPGQISQYFQNYNANKNSVVIDLQTAKGRQLLLDLVPKFDVFVENYGPGVIEKLDIGYDVMKEINPGIIYGRIKGFGLTGPWAGYKCYDWVAQAAAGTFSVTGEGDGPPMMPGPTIGDSGTGMQMALGISAAYTQKLRTGEGQFIEVAMQEAVTMFMRTLGLAEWGTEAAAPRQGNARGAPTNVYPCKGGGPNDHVFVMIVTTRMWDSFCMAIDRPEFAADPRFEDGIARLEHADELIAEVTKWSLQHTKWEAMEVLGEAGVPCSATFDTRDLFTAPHLKERDFIQEVEHPEAGTVQLMRNPIRMSGSDVPLEAAPLLGDATNRILASDLGLDAGALDALKAEGVVA